MTPKEKEDILNLLDEAIAQNKGLQELVNSMIDIENLIDRNYNAQIRRGQNLTPIACLAKINEEIEEYNKEWAYVNNEEAQQKELSDIILSCFTKAKVMGWDIMQVLSEKVAYNEKRND